MKQLMSIFAVFVLMFSGIAAAFAQDTETNVSADTSVTATDASAPVAVETSADASSDTTTDTSAVTATEEQSSTDAEVATMTTSEGAQLRLTQLQERIETAISHGKAVIASVSANSTSSLQASLDKLNALDEQVKVLDPNADDAVATFVSIKKSAIDAIKEFRDEARKLITEDKRDAVRKRMKDKEDQRLKDLREKITKKMDDFKARVIADLLVKLGASNPDLVAKIQAGTATRDEIVTALKSAYSTLTPAKKSDVRQKIKEDAAQARVRQLSALDKFKERIDVRKSNAEANNRTHVVKALTRVDTHIQVRKDTISRKMSDDNESESENDSDSNEEDGQ